MPALKYFKILTFSIFKRFHASMRFFRITSRPNFGDEDYILDADRCSLSWSVAFSQKLRILPKKLKKEKIENFNQPMKLR